MTQFGPLREASLGVEGLSPAAGSVVAFSFFLYHAAKGRIGFAAISVGLTRLKEDAKALDWLTVIVGALACLANAVVMIFGRMEMAPSGATGVLATLLLAICLLHLTGTSDVC